MPGRQCDYLLAVNELLPTTMSPRFGSRANALMPRSISLAAPKLIGLNYIGATDWIAPNMPISATLVGSRTIPARVTRGAISLSISNHFALIPYSYW